MTDQKLIDDVLAAFADREITAPSRDDIARVLEVFETSLRLCGCGACTTARRERIGLTDHDLTSLARVLHEVVYSPGASFDRAVPGIQEHMRACAEKVAAALPWVVPTPEVELVVGEVHAPNDDEREALDYAIRCAIPTDLEYRPLWKLIRAIQDAVLAAGFRRTEVPEPSAARPGPPVYLAADLWDALGAPTADFDSYYARNGWADTWANLLGTVRDHFKPKCGHDADGEPCVLTAGHLPPHYGASDVGRSEPVPVPEPQVEPSDAEIDAGAQALFDEILRGSSVGDVGGTFERCRNSARAVLRAASAVTKQGENR